MAIYPIRADSLDENPYREACDLIGHFNPLKLATKIGVNESIVLQCLLYRLKGSNNERDGRRWVYDTYKAWQRDHFPFFSFNTVRRAFESLERQSLILSTGRYNKMSRDQTRWYAIDFAQVVNLAKSKPAVEESPCAQIGQMGAENLTENLNENAQMPKLGTPLPGTGILKGNLSDEDLTGSNACSVKLSSCQERVARKDKVSWLGNPKGFPLRNTCWLDSPELINLQRLKVYDVALHLGLPTKKIVGHTRIQCPSGEHRDDHWSCDLNEHREKREKYEVRAKCYACSFNENAIGLVRAVNRCSFNEACDWLADTFNLPKPNPKSIKKQKEVSPEVWADAVRYWRERGVECTGRTLISDKVYFSPSRKAWTFNHSATEDDPGGTGCSHRLLYPGPDGDKIIQDTGATTDLFKLGTDYRSILLVEGFPDCVSVFLNTGRTAWTLTCGALSRIPAHRYEDFRKAERIIVLYDRDKAGNTGWQQIVKQLRKITAVKVYVVEIPPDFKPGEKTDIAEWFAAGNGKKEFEELLNRAVLQTLKGGKTMPQDEPEPSSVNLEEMFRQAGVSI